MYLADDFIQFMHTLEIYILNSRLWSGCFMTQMIINILKSAFTNQFTYIYQYLVTSVGRQIVLYFVFWSNFQIFHGFKSKFVML